MCSFIGALTTILLIYLPSVSGNTFEEQVALHLNRLYMGKLWILFLHPQFNFMAVLGISFVFFKKYSEIVFPGALLMCVWAISEIFQQAYMIDAVNLLWRPEYMREIDTAGRAVLMTHLKGAEGVSQSLYMLVQYGFGLGSLLIGLVF